MNLQTVVRMLVVFLAGSATFSFALACAAGNRAQPSTLSDSHQLDRATHLHVYNYVLTNPGSNTAGLDTLVIKLEPGVDVITDFRSPPGWRAFYSAEQGTVMWAATGYNDVDAEDSTGNLPPSDYSVSPGETLAGFSFKSFSPPGAGTAITQSYAPLFIPQSEEDLEVWETTKELSTLPEDNGFKLSTIVPVPDADWTGNRRPAVDGFLVFANIQEKAAYSESVLIVFRLGSAGESVDATTLRVSLNGADVTGMFKLSDQYKGYAAVFSGDSPPVVSGTNVLRTSVEGFVPGTTRRAADTDRITFDFVP